MPACVQVVSLKELTPEDWGDYGASDEQYAAIQQKIRKWLNTDQGIQKDFGGSDDSSSSDDQSGGESKTSTPMPDAHWHSTDEEEKGDDGAVTPDVDGQGEMWKYAARRFDEEGPSNGPSP